jgi:outer membrane protein assembly factor BamB
MRKPFKIILIILGILLLAGGFFAYKIYTFTMGSEELSGKQGEVPPVEAKLPPLSFGSDDWPHWRGLHGNGMSSATGLKTNWNEGLKLLWKVDFLCQDKSTASWAAPVVQGNRLIVPGRDSKNDLLFCLDAGTGKLLWRGSYEAEAENSHGPGPRATPYIDNDKVFSFGRSGDLVCWNLLDGTIVWRQNVKAAGGVEPQWGYSSSPYVYKNMVLVQAGGSAQVAAYNKLNGELLWKSMDGDAGYSAFTLAVPDKDTFLLAFQAKGLSCLQPADGKMLWTLPWETDYGVNATTPIAEKNHIFITSGYGMGGELIEFTKQGAKVNWKNQVMASQHSDPVLINGYLFGYSGESSGRDGQFKCVEMATGKEMWSTTTMSWGTTVYIDGHLICLDIKGNLYLVKADPTKFTLVSKFEKALESVTNPAWTCPVIANDKLYLRYLQELVCYELK